MGELEHEWVEMRVEGQTDSAVGKRRLNMYNGISDKGHLTKGHLL